MDSFLVPEKIRFNNFSPKKVQFFGQENPYPSAIFIMSSGVNLIQCLTMYCVAELMAEVQTVHCVGHSSLRFGDWEVSC